MALFVAISSCNRFELNGWNDAMRQTWLQDAKRLGIEYKFFHGEGSEPKDDVVVLDCADGYEALTWKTREKFKWAYEHGYTDVFHCYHDTYAAVERLLTCGYENYDFFGEFMDRDGYRFCKSGGGYFISQSAMWHVVNELPEHPNYKGVAEEDVWVSFIVQRHPELKVFDAGNQQTMPCLLTPQFEGPRRTNKFITGHLSTIYDPVFKGDGSRESERKYRPEYMFLKHKEWLES